VGEVITKLAEDAYFMRVDNRVTQVPPLRTHEHRHQEATNRSPADGGRAPEENNHRTPIALGSQLEDPPGAATAQAAALVAATAAGAHLTVLAGELVAAAIAEAEATQTAMSPASHVAATMLTTELKRFVATWLVKIGSSPDMCFFKVISLTKRKA
jgi:hypothetical protein